MARYNRTLGKFHLDGIPAAQRGRPQIEVSFDIDANGIVHVSAKDLGTGKEQKITITSSTGLGESEIDRRDTAAESHRDEDHERRKQVEMRNHLDALVYNTEKTYNEQKEKLGPDDKGQVEEALAEAKKALESNDGDKMKAALEDLNKAGAEFYADVQAATQAAGAAAGPQPGAPQAEPAPKTEKKADDVVDADFQAVDDEKKK